MSHISHSPSRTVYWRACSSISSRPYVNARCWNNYCRRQKYNFCVLKESMQQMPGTKRIWRGCSWSLASVRYSMVYNGWVNDWNLDRWNKPCSTPLYKLVFKKNILTKCLPHEWSIVGDRNHACKAFWPPYSLTDMLLITSSWISSVNVRTPF